MLVDHRDFDPDIVIKVVRLMHDPAGDGSYSLLRILTYNDLGMFVEYLLKNKPPSSRTDSVEEALFVGNKDLFELLIGTTKNPI
jgi:hypothetical protein